jgi:hypothetical protein
MPLCLAVIAGERSDEAISPRDMVLSHPINVKQKPAGKERNGSFKFMLCEKR